MPVMKEDSTSKLSPPLVLVHGLLDTPRCLIGSGRPWDSTAIPC